MKVLIQLAYRNLVGAGLRTWLNVIVLSFSFVVMIFFNGLMDGWNVQSKKANIEWSIGQGQLRHEAYDPYDPFTIADAHAPLLHKISEPYAKVLLRQATIYNEDRGVPILLKGIENKELLQLPTDSLAMSTADIPVVIGNRMAETIHAELGEQFLLRWRDKNGTFDAANVTVVGVFDTDVVAVDAGQVWVQLDRLYEMTGLEGHITYAVLGNAAASSEVPEGWSYHSQEDLLQTLTDMIGAKKASSAILYVILLGIALLAIFDTQVLSVFRRQKEIGTFVALGMTRARVIVLFTLEGTMNAVLAMGLGALYGAPLLWALAHYGVSFDLGGQDIGVPMAETIYPVYGFGLILMSVLILTISAAVVSYLPSRKIAKMNVVDALKGKLL